MNWKQDIAEALEKGFMHRPDDGAECVTCGARGNTYAMHVIEYYHDDKIAAPSFLIPTSNSRQTTRGIVPLCIDCCPACDQCRLPIATTWARKVKELLSEENSGISFVMGNGYCNQHIHVWQDIKAQFRSASLANQTPGASVKSIQVAPEPLNLVEALEAEFGPTEKRSVWRFVDESSVAIIQSCLDNIHRECGIDNYTSTASIPKDVLLQIYMYATWMHDQYSCEKRITLIMVHQYVDTVAELREEHRDNWAELMHAQSDIAPAADSYIDFIQKTYIDGFGEITLTKVVSDD